MTDKKQQKQDQGGKGEGDSVTQTMRYDTSGAESFEFRAGDPRVRLRRRTKEEIAEAERQFTIQAH
jgi:hypothetical protein